MTNNQSIGKFEIEKFNQYDLPAGQKLSTCPLCSSERKPQNQKQKCLMMDWETGLGTCQHCGEVIQLHTYVKKAVDKKYKLPEWKNNTDLSEKLVKWFEGRGISQFTLRRLKITEGTSFMPQSGKFENTVQFNYFRDEVLINVKYRDARKHFKMVSGAEKILYNLDHIRTTKEAIIVEGEIDCLSIVECGIMHCVSIPNGATTGHVNLEFLDACIDHLDNKEKIILALDNDEPGQNITRELVRRLGPERCFLADLSPYKDANDVLVQSGRDTLKNRLKNASSCPLEDVMVAKDLESDLVNFYQNGVPKGFTINLKTFDDIFSTYTSQFIIVTGIPSSGKSDFVDQMVLGYNLQHDWKIAFYSPENKPEYLHLDKLCRKMAGYRPRNAMETKTVKWQAIMDHLNENFFFMSYDTLPGLKKILEKGAELVKRKGIKCLVLDPFNKITLQESKHLDINQYTNDYLNAIDTFCRKHDVLVILVAHPVKMRKVNGKTPEPDFYDIKGGGEFYDMSPHGILIHRLYNPNVVKVKILKIKFNHLGENMAHCHLGWNPRNGRYSVIHGDIENMNYTIDFKNNCWLSEKENETTQETIDFHPAENNDEPDNVEDNIFKERDDLPF